MASLSENYGFASMYCKSQHRCYTCSVPTTVVAACNCMSMLVCSLTSEAVVGDLSVPHVVPGVAATAVVRHAFSFSTESWTAVDHTRVDFTVGKGETIGTDREICENKNNYKGKVDN